MTAETERENTESRKFLPKAVSGRKICLSAERGWFLQKEGCFCRNSLFLQKESISAEIASFCRNALFLQKEAISAETTLYFCRKKAFLQKHPFLQKVTEMQKQFGSISAPSETAETEMFLLSVDLYTLDTALARYAFRVNYGFPLI